MKRTLPIPTGLKTLLDAGLWPRDLHHAASQDLHPLVSRECVRRFAPEERTIYLQPPPFPTVAQEVGRFASKSSVRDWALDQIEPAIALIIGDFGIGSDAPIILDYRNAMANPPVLRLRWQHGSQNTWVQCAANFDEFADLLSLRTASS